jgi:ferrous iron transport protein B
MLIFGLVMALVFQAVFAGAAPLMKGIDDGFAFLGRWIGARMAAWGVAGGALESLAVDGVVGGLGGVMVFLPQILILFFFIAVLEDCGYMARAAYLMDRAMVCVGLSGKSFIPMLSSFACSIPGIMAARVIENERDRLTTMLVAPLMTCSARLPIYALLIAAFIPPRTYFGILGLQGLVLAALYVLGVLVAVVVALVLKRTLLRGDAPPFIMELPVYKWPSPRTVLFRMLERAVVFLRNAGSIILALSIIIWAALYYPHNPQAAQAEPEVRRLEARLAQLPSADPARDRLQAELERALAGAYQRQSWLGRLGRSVEPLFRPLGWDWRISSAVLASFPAREVVVATLAVIFNLGKDVDASSQQGAAQFKARLVAATWEGSTRKLFNVPVALSIMVFFALCAQCAATLAVMKRETNSWRWPAFTFAYMTMLAYLGALLTYQLGAWIGL